MSEVAYLESDGEPPQTSPSSTITVQQTNDGYEHHALSAVIAAMVFNLLIAGAKLGVATWITRSTALFSEGLHSAADAFNSLTLLFGIIQGKRPPDRTHPFGYGLETNVWAMLASVVLFLSSLYAVWSGWQRFHQPEVLESPFWAIVILVGSVVFEVFALTAASKAVLHEVEEPCTLFNAIPKAFGQIKYVVSPTTRFVFWEDTVALVGAGIALLAIVLGEQAVHLGWLPKAYAHYPDAVASVLIGLLLLALAINLFGYNRSFLTGASASQPVEAKIHEVVEDTHGISDLLELKTMDHGVSGLLVHLKVEVEPDTPIKEVDDLIEHLKDRLKLHVDNVRDVIVEVIANEADEAWEERLNALLKQGVEQEVINERDSQLLSNCFNFTELQATDVMVPRADVVSVELETPLAEVAELFIQDRHSKLPVYKERVDQIIGVIHERDVFDCIRQGRTETPVHFLLRALDTYPETKKINDLLEDFKRKKIQMAAVADEHGGFAGLVTITDIMEELVGELWDEPDEVNDEEIIHLTPSELRLSGKVFIDELNERFSLNLPEDDYKTIGGFVFGLLGREPEPNDVVQFEDLTFTVLECDGARVVALDVKGDRSFLELSGN